MKGMGKRIKKHRKRCGLTQVALSKKVAVTQGMLSEWENGNLFPDVTRLVRLCRALGV